MIITVTLNPAVDKTVTLPMFTIGKVNRVTGMRMDPGGKGINVSKVIHGFGGRSVAMGILGGATGEYIKNCLDDMGIEHDFLYVPEPTRTNMKIVDPQLGSNTDINEAGPFVSAQSLENVFIKVAARVCPGDIVVLAGKTPPGADESLYADWTRKLRGRGAKVYLDVDGPLLRLGVEALPDLIKPNDEEFAQLLGRELHSLLDIKQAALVLISRGISRIAVSLGARGVLFVSKDSCIHAQGFKVPVVSTVGAGDATMAALAYGYAQSLSYDATMRLALAAGAASVMCDGTQAVSLDTVQKLAQKVELISL